MNEVGIIQWILGILIPTFLSISTFWNRLNKERTTSENRISVIESEIRVHANDLKEIKDDVKSQREDLKLLQKLNTQSDMMLKMMDEIKQDIKNNKME